ncbi:meprin A subunit beta [Kryptolebias marmoratus]|uniref:meprin A subunit beta n=1 Tax=Kryptolebias marmoratus TaxID=37003 RepID=UPI0007F8A3CE|nr:meprin A subunit beta [Kryptolebias marmoratus]
MYVRLLSGDFDDQLEWPCLRRQMNFQLLDQNPNIQQQMSKQRNFISVETHVTSSGTLVWSNPRETGKGVFFENGKLVYGGPLWGYFSFANSEDLQSREVLKGGSAIFMFNFEDLTPLVNGSALPCPQVRSVNIENPPSILEGGPCSPRISTTTSPHPQTDKIRTSTTISPPPTTTGHRISTTTSPPPTTTNKSRYRHT